MATSLIVHEQFKPSKSEPKTQWRPPVRVKPTRAVEKPVAQGMHFFSFIDLLILNMTCVHSWSWPQTLKELTYPVKYAATEKTPEVRYDAHQTCCTCGNHRLWQIKPWSPGPTFRRLVTK